MSLKIQSRGDLILVENYLAKTNNPVGIEYR